MYANFQTQHSEIIKCTKSEMKLNEIHKKEFYFHRSAWPTWRMRDV